MGGLRVAHYSTKRSALNAFNTAVERLSQPEWRDALRGLNRGIEREALRIDAQGRLAQDIHPVALGSALTHPWITTDFSEALMELITPVYQDPDALLDHLADTHSFVLRHLNGQRLWPFSMPCFIDSAENIPIAQYGTSHTGQMKTLYRVGLQHRYGAMMQAIAGLHFNFSVPKALWEALGVDGEDQDAISERYFSLLRHFKRHAWVLAYLFGASPSLCRSFLQGRDPASGLPFEERDGTLYLPYATSLRMSDLGYTNKAQDKLQVSINSIDEYIRDLKEAISLPSEEYAKFGVKVNGEYRQLNANVLQIENELYATMRPKRTAASGETPSDALARGGVEYVEVRALDVNPFEPLGISRDQILLLDLFLLDGLLEPQPARDEQELTEQKANFKEVVLDGRRPGKTLMRNGQPVALADWMSELMARWGKLAAILDAANGDERYGQALNAWLGAARDPEQTLSAKVLAVSLAEGHGHWADRMATEHREALLNRDYARLSEAQLVTAAADSLKAQSAREAEDQGSFEQFLADYFRRQNGGSDN
ncbi:glutamate--cysteine ligase [Ferrimonas balearica]|uniref:glutamate--cysteine ligase n=1 Tax=Ferrimonas balearica TaxID=44012 RepID=UPI001C99870E|nr:glutamate--cysteine ligase [Ferrimonas balearica]MBY5921457.1 glutamate--cysteine ligase [Ferrimonas balearica]MBY5995858.1 glutamate--cysteine ligase [Ferrimonas balearica]